MEMTQRAQEAKAHGLVIINDEDALFVPEVQRATLPTFQL